MALSCVRDAQTGKTQLSVPTSQASHVMLDAHEHTIVLKSQIYTTLYHPTALCNSALQQDGRCYNITKVRTTILYYDTITILVYHGTHFASGPDGRRYHVGENLSVPMPSCPSYPCERLMLLLSHQEWHLKYEAAKKIILRTKTQISSTEMNASPLHKKMIIST